VLPFLFFFITLFHLPDFDGVTLIGAPLGDMSGGLCFRFAFGVWIIAINYRVKLFPFSYHGVRC
jgi:hypothetical protein